MTTEQKTEESKSNRAAKRKNYSTIVKQLSKPGEAILASLTPERAHTLHMAVGIATEAGELLSSVKKHVIYDQPIDTLNVFEELGDIEFYLEGLRSVLSFKRNLIIEENIEKLLIRYGSGYSDKAATERRDKQDVQE